MPHAIRATEEGVHRAQTGGPLGSVPPDDRHQFLRGNDRSGPLDGSRGITVASDPGINRNAPLHGLLGGTTLHLAGALDTLTEDLTPGPAADGGGAGRRERRIANQARPEPFYLHCGTSRFPRLFR